MTSTAVAQMEKQIALLEKVATPVRQVNLYSNSLFGRLRKYLGETLNTLFGRWSNEPERPEAQHMADRAKYERLLKLIYKYRNFSAHKAVAPTSIWTSHADAAIDLQLLRAEFDSDWDRIHDYYAEVLELLDEKFELHVDVEWIRSEVARHYQEVKYWFSSIRGRIRSLSKALSVCNNSIDKRKIFREKITCFIRRVDDEDHSK